MLWAYFHYYQLFLDNTEITAPPTSSQAIVVYQAANNRIMQANQAAREAGITLGMGLAQAGALCPQLTILDYPKKCIKSYLEQCFKPPFKTHKKRNPFWFL